MIQTKSNQSTPFNLGHVELTATLFQDDELGDLRITLTTNMNTV